MLKAGTTTLPVRSLRIDILRGTSTNDTGADTGPLTVSKLRAAVETLGDIPKPAARRSGRFELLDLIMEPPFKVGDR